MAMGFLAFLALGSLVEMDFLERVWKKIELLKNIWIFIGECPQWLNYDKHLDENVQTLTRKMETLRCLEADVITKLGNEELNPRKKRKSEVENWLRNVECKKSDVQSIEHNYRGMNFLLRAWWGSRVEKNIREVDELSQQGRFSESLVLESSQTRGEVLLTKTLVDTQKRTMENIRTCVVMNDGVSIIGVLGMKGIGKTSIVENVHNGLIDSSNFDHVYWVSVSPQYSILGLQDDIAKVIGFNLDENDERRRAARLHRALNRGKKIVLILDGLSRHFDLDRVGIPTQWNGCKLILTTRSQDVCRRMGCREIIEVEPLPLDEAERLFMENVRGSNDPVDPEIEEIANLIVRECHGLPFSIIDMADKLRGVDDIHEWRNRLNELQNELHD